MKIALILLALLVAAGRFTVPGHGLSWPGTYEALAHIVVGVLFALAFRRDTRWTAIICLVAITVFEVVMFFARAS